ncbi:hypothetical protein, partial [Sphingobium chlorophenolicum]|uniref:hypothetical protein n=1 Tax=Sphingobium chlorophenolicum TaxID=46429 RepID=UPI001C3F5A6C
RRIISDRGFWAFAVMVGWRGRFARGTGSLVRHFLSLVPAGAGLLSLCATMWRTESINTNNYFIGFFIDIADESYRLLSS